MGRSECKSFGMDEQEFRTALTRLELNGTITKTSTKKGTTITLIDTSIFDPNFETPTKTQNNSNRTPTTNKEGNKGKCINKGNEGMDAHKVGSGFSVQELKEYDPTTIPAPSQQVVRFVKDFDVDHGAAQRWWASSRYYDWVIPGKDGKPTRMRSWPHALLAFAEADKERSTSQDSLSSDEFWAWFKSEYGDRDDEWAEDVNDDAWTAVEAWIDLNQRRDWKVLNRQNGQLEPLRDYRKAFVAYYDAWHVSWDEGTWAYGQSA